MDSHLKSEETCKDLSSNFDWNGRNSLHDFLSPSREFFNVTFDAIWLMRSLMINKLTSWKRKNLLIPLFNCIDNTPAENLYPTPLLSWFSSSSSSLLTPKRSLNSFFPLKMSPLIPLFSPKKRPLPQVGFSSSSTTTTLSLCLVISPSPPPKTS